MAKKDVAEPKPTPPAAPPKAKKPVRRVSPPPSNQKAFDPKEYDLEDEAVETPEFPVAPEPPEETLPPAAPPRDEAGRFTKPAPAHSPALVRRALEVNLTQADIDGMSSDDLFNEILYRQQQIRDFQENERRQQPRGPIAPEPPPREEVFDPDNVVDPVIADRMRRDDQRIKENDKRIKELEDKLAKAEERDQERERQTRNERIDRAFQSMPEYADVFGKGSLEECSPDEWDARDVVLGKVDKDRSKLSLEKKICAVSKRIVERFRGHTAPQETPSKSEPVYEQLPPKPSATNGSDYEDEELAKRRAVWNERTVAEPTARKGAPEPKGIQKAKKTFLKLEQEAGRGENQLAEELTNELPE